MVVPSSLRCAGLELSCPDLRDRFQCLAQVVKGSPSSWRSRMCVRRLEPCACVAYELLAADLTVVVVVPVVAAEALSCLRV